MPVGRLLPEGRHVPSGRRGHGVRSFVSRHFVFFVVGRVSFLSPLGSGGGVGVGGARAQGGWRRRLASCVFRATSTHCVFRAHRLLYEYIYPVTLYVYTGTTPRHPPPRPGIPGRRRRAGLRKRRKNLIL
jgi:hypothetical protein